jgi:hypothetical protein
LSSATFIHISRLLNTSAQLVELNFLIYFSFVTLLQIVSELSFVILMFDQ